jgi:ribonuclease D
MNLITDSGELADFCRRLSNEEFVTVDTEFLRDNTYWPRLCVVQLAGDDEAGAIDAIAEGIDLSPLYELMSAPNVMKVFHAGRQDVEIFFHQAGAIPAPVFDTQIAAMVCGFGDSVGYETLVSKLANGRIDKSARFTDWSLRPLTRKQIDYAIADVTYLRDVYRKLAQRLERTGRSAWLSEEMAVLTDPATYRLEPAESWRRLKIRSRSSRFLAILREIAAWRETKAQYRDIPRNRVLRDEALMEIAAHAPQTVDELARTRGLPRNVAEGRVGEEILAAVASGRALPEHERPTAPEKYDIPRGLGPVIDLLKVLLKMKCEAEDVAQKLVATSADLERIAADDEADVRALQGWRREIFGEEALALKHGQIALTVEGQSLQAVELEDPEEDEAPRRAG